MSRSAVSLLKTWPGFDSSWLRKRSGLVLSEPSSLTAASTTAGGFSPMRANCQSA